MQSHPQNKSKVSYKSGQSGCSCLSRLDHHAHPPLWPDSSPMGSACALKYLQLSSPLSAGPRPCVDGFRMHAEIHTQPWFACVPIVFLQSKITQTFLVPWMFSACLVSEVVFFFQLQLPPLKTVSASYPCPFLHLTRLFFLKLRWLCNLPASGCLLASWPPGRRRSQPAPYSSGNTSLSVAR